MTIIGVPPLTPEELAHAESARSERAPYSRVHDFNGLVESGLPERLARLLTELLPDSETTTLAELQIRREGRQLSVQLVAVLPEGD